MAHIKTLRGPRSRWDHFDSRQEAETFLGGLRRSGQEGKVYRATLPDGRTSWCVHQPAAASERTGGGPPRRNTLQEG